MPPNTSLWCIATASRILFLHLSSPSPSSWSRLPELMHIFACPENTERPPLYIWRAPCLYIGPFRRCRSSFSHLHLPRVACSSISFRLPLKRLRHSIIPSNPSRCLYATQLTTATYIVLGSASAAAPARSLVRVAPPPRHSHLSPCLRLRRRHLFRLLSPVCGRGFGACGVFCLEYVFTLCF